jgi:hypothetical protein
MLRFKVRLGLSEGRDLLVNDINGNRNLAGSGINTAQRVMTLAEGGNILLNDLAYQFLSQRGAYFKSSQLAGPFTGEIKHRQTLTVYQYRNGKLPGLNNRKPDSLTDVTPSKPRSRRKPVNASAQIITKVSVGYGPPEIQGFWHSRGGWKPQITSVGLELIDHAGFRNVLFAQHFPDFVNGVIVCRVFMRPNAIFNVVVRANLVKNSFYMARLDTRSVYRDCILFKAENDSSWKECNDFASLKGFSPTEKWMDMRVVVRKNIISLYRDEQLMDQITNANIDGTVIGIFAELANVYLDSIVVAQE